MTILTKWIKGGRKRNTIMPAANDAAAATAAETVLATTAPSAPPGNEHDTRGHRDQCLKGVNDDHQPRALVKQEYLVGEMRPEIPDGPGKRGQRQNRERRALKLGAIRRCTISSRSVKTPATLGSNTAASSAPLSASWRMARSTPRSCIVRTARGNALAVTIIAATVEARKPRP